jgi:hypothetical protein
MNPVRSVGPLGPKRSGGGERIASLAREVPDDIQRWTARRRMALVLSILKGEITLDDGARQHGLTVAEIEEWKQRMLAAAHNALRSRPRDADAMKDEQIRRLREKVGQLVVDVDLLREALQHLRSPNDAETADD